jgi:hypothetical protein
LEEVLDGRKNEYNDGGHDDEENGEEDDDEDDGAEVYKRQPRKSTIGH